LSAIRGDLKHKCKESAQVGDFEWVKSRICLKPMAFAY